MAIKRMLAPIEEFLSLDDQRRHPGRIIPINLPRKLDKRVPIGCRFDARNLDGHQLITGSGCSISWTNDREKFSCRRIRTKSNRFITLTSIQKNQAGWSIIK